MTCILVTQHPTGDAEAAWRDAQTQGRQWIAQCCFDIEAKLRLGPVEIAAMLSEQVHRQHQRLINGD